LIVGGFKVGGPNKANANTGKGKGDSVESIEPSLVLPTFHVSAATQTIVEMVYQTLTEAEQLNNADR
jgi:hypothetical protein